jgi:ATP-dependent DNA helicase
MCYYNRGLGKTIQIISLIAQLRASGTPGPFLIVGPLATLPNWMNEFKKWLPSCPVVLYHGSKADRLEMREKRLKYMILDEGHRIKNRSCRLVKELKQIPSTSRLLLTGTPIQVTIFFV